MVYQSPINAVAIDYSVESNCVELFFIELVDDELPDVQGRDAGWLLVLRADSIAAPTGLSASEVEAGLAFWADALPRYAADYLAGDLTVMTDIEQAIQRRNTRGRMTDGAG